MTDIASSDMQTDDALPAGWKWARLWEVCEIINGSTPSKREPRYWDEDSVPWFTVNDIRRIGRRIYETQQHASRAALEETSLRLLPAKSVLICCTASVGEYAIAEIPLATNQQFNGLVVKEEYRNELDPEFLFQLASQFKERLLRLGGKTAFHFVSVRDLKTLHIPLPPLSEQERIARVLDECLASIARAKDAAELQLEAAVALPGAYLRQALPAEGDDLPAGWKWARLGEVCERISNINPKKCPDDTFLYVDISAIDRELKVITEPKKLLGKNAPSRARKQIRRNDVIVSTTRPNLNAVALVPEYLDGQVCSTGFCVLRPDESIDSRYLFNFTKTDAFVSSLSQGVNGAVYPAVTDSQVLDLPVPLPPLDEQRRIASDLDVRIAVAGMLVSRIRE